MISNRCSHVLRRSYPSDHLLLSSGLFRSPNGDRSPRGPLVRPLARALVSRSDRPELRFEHARPEARVIEVRPDAVLCGVRVRGMESARPGMNRNGETQNDLRMPQPIRRATLVAALAATALSTHAQDGDIAAGHAFARKACSACHLVDAQQQRPSWRIFIGPAFGNIANTAA